MQRLFVMRHGQSQGNADKIVVGNSESPLTELGQQQARLAGEQARGLGIDLIACSPLSRAQQTAQIVAEGIGYPIARILTLPGLAERNLGDLQGQSYARNQQRSGNFIQTEDVPGAESLAGFQARVHGALHAILASHGHKCVLIICHLGVARMLQLIAQGRPLTAFYDLPKCDNARIEPLG